MLGLKVNYLVKWDPGKYLIELFNPDARLKIERS